MIIQLQHDKFDIVKEGGVNSILTPPLNDFNGGLYVKQISIRREFTFKKEISNDSMVFYLFECPKDHKIINFTLLNSIRLLKKGAGNPNNNYKIIYVSNSHLSVIKNRTIIKWHVSKNQRNFGYLNDVIEITLNIFITNNSVSTIKNSMG